MMLTAPIYLDNNATTRVDPRVLDAMLPHFCDSFGNPASNRHTYGWQAKEAVEHARNSICKAINATDVREIVFTSGATESINLALKGTIEACDQARKHIITVATEHKAVLDTCEHLQRSGCEVTYLPVRADGLIDLGRFQEAFRKDTVLVSVMAANNEIGVMQDLITIGAICRKNSVLFHTDATQALGKIPFDVETIGASMASFSAHKIYGPKGIGALYVRRKAQAVPLVAQMDGGGHESGIRSGTLNVPGIVGFGKAVELCVAEMDHEAARLTTLRNKLRDEIMRLVDHVFLNGHPTNTLPGTLNLSFRNVDGDALLLELNGIALSSGSACTSASSNPSHVLKALGISDEHAQTSVRFSLGRFNSEGEIDYTIHRCAEAIDYLRSISPL